MLSVIAENLWRARNSLPFCNARHTVDLSRTGGHVIDIQNEINDEETALPSNANSEVRSPLLVLSFQNLTYRVKMGKKLSFPTSLSRHNSLVAAETSPERVVAKQNLGTRAKVILNDISGEARDGEIFAVLGSSGSGKTTLIDALANRISKEGLEGTISLNGETLKSQLLRVISSYLMQDDLLYPMLTVEETLMFAADFRLSSTHSKTEKKMRVQALINQLGLRDAAHTMIGDEGHRGVSGGERRRVSIGIDIIHNPIVLFLDEPTSGLDSTSAFMVVKVLKRIAQSGSIVIMSIHQPSYRIIKLLDSLIFLSHGQPVYYGSPMNLSLFFTDFGHPIPENENGIEFAIDLIHKLEGSLVGTQSLVRFNKSWQNQKQSDNQNTTTHGLSLKEAISASSISHGKLVSGATDAASPTPVLPKFANTFWIEMVVLSKRSFLNSLRIPMVFLIRLAAIMVSGFALATMFWQLDSSTKGIQKRFGFFAFSMSTIFYICADALPMFIQERYIFMRETAYNSYRRSSFVLSHLLVTIPGMLLLSLTFAVLTFWTVGLDGGLSGFFFYFGIIFSSFWAGTSFITFLSGVVPQIIIGGTIAAAIMGSFLLFSGFYISANQIPPYWIWLHYASIVKYPLEAVLQNEFEDPTKCFVRGVEIFDNTPLGAVPMAMKVKLFNSLSSSLGINVTSTTCLTTGPQVLQQQGITRLSKWDCMWITFCWGIFFRILFYFCLLLGSKNKKR